MRTVLRSVSVIAFFVAALVALLGCGGHGSDSRCVITESGPVAAYVGSYTATFAPKSGAVGGSLDLVFAVDANGRITGTAHNPSIFPEVDYAVTGSATAVTGCGDASELTLGYTDASGAPEEIGGAQKSADTLVGVHRVTRGEGGLNIEAGTLTIAKASE